MYLLIKGGPMTFFILICSIVGVAIFINKIIHLHRAQIDIKDFMPGLKNELISKRFTEAVGICEETPGPAASVLKTGIVHHEDGRSVMETAMERVSIQEIARMERSIPILATIAVISPLFGLLGTVFGLINVFQKMTEQGGLLTALNLSSGMWQALIAVAFGLSVAIPSYMAYNYLVVRIHRIVIDMELAAKELLEIIGE